jgi:PAS domain S-box-containing protein
MKDADFKVPGAGDPRLAAHADGVLPAWLWSADGSRILWANPAGVDVFGARDDAQLTDKIFGPSDPHRRQIAQLAGRLAQDGTVRMERLRGFGAVPGGLATCSCSRLDFPDGRHGVLVVSAVRVVRTRRPKTAAIPPLEPAPEAAPPSAAESPAAAPPPSLPHVDYASPEQSNEAPAEFALFDAFAEDEQPLAEQPPLDRQQPTDDLQTIAADTEQKPGDAARADQIAEAVVLDNSPSTDLDGPVDTSQETLAPASSDLRMDALAEPPHNVLPFRPIGETKPPALTPVENSAFDELARQLSARLDNGDNAETGEPIAAETTRTAAEPEPVDVAPPAGDRPDWLTPPEPPALGQSRRDKALLDLLPAGVLIYRLDRLLYANPAFLRRIGHDSLQALEEAGGLDALFVEPGVSTSSSTSEAGTPVRISASRPDQDGEPTATAARLHAISWDGEAALALICSEGPVDAAPVPAPSVAADTPSQAAPQAAGAADAEELGAILDTTAEGIVMFDEEGNITACNRSAEALFGYDGDDFVTHNLADLFAPESRHGVLEYFASVKNAGVASLLDHGHETLGRVHQGGFIPLSITIGRTRADGPNFFAVFRDLSQSRKSESELQQARRLTERAASAKSDMLARISHELRAPLNAIIGFAEVMIDGRFGPLDNERYVEYMKDIRASGQRVISVVDDLLDLSKVEAGKIDLSFASQNLNEMVESCVTVLQPQANRERIIIRTSLAHTLPPVVADARALRQIAMNLIGTSIHLAKAGGQVIVSTALNDFGDVALRVRDTGQAMNDNEVAAALEPFGMHAPSDRLTDASAVSLSLTKALVEANRAQFHIRPGPHAGTLVEVVFSRTPARA